MNSPVDGPAPFGSASEQSLASEDGTPAARRSERTRRRGPSDWRQGGRAVRRWDHIVLFAALVGTGTGLIAQSAVVAVFGPGASAVGSVALWGGMAAAVVFALARSRPIPLTSFRPVDLVWGVAFGLALRMLQAWLSDASSAPFPVVPSLGDGVSASWFLTVAVPAAIVAPTIEEFLFRGVILVSLFQLLRRSVGSVASAITALLASTGGFVLLHASSGVLSFPTGVQLFVVGLVCSAVVLLTGRIWGAILTHAVYNISYLIVVLVGTLLS